MKLLTKNTRAELCCFGSACCGITAFLLAVFAVDFTSDAPMSEARILVLVAAGLAFVLMAVLTAIALRMDRDDAVDVEAGTTNLLE